LFDRRTKPFYFVLEGLNALATGYYGYYVFFLLRDRFGFGNFGNLCASSMSGFVFVFAAWQGGRFAQRYGYFTALRVGWIGMASALLLGWVAPGLVLQIAVFLAWTACMCFTWPTLEALTSEGETEKSLPQMLGLYNVVWSGGSALAYFCGGAMFEHLGRSSLYWLPALVHGAQLVTISWLARRVSQPKLAANVAPPPHSPERSAFGQSVSPKTFLRMAWLANPFAYIAINTLLATIPGLARELRLTTTQSGLFCSVWFFARLATFALLWCWTGWHYRFRWLLAAFLGLMASFAALLLVRRLEVLVLAQVVFGLAAGLLYYSSLFYSMDVGETKGEHGGLHEAAIGAGMCFGPAIGATGLFLAPANPDASAYAVSGLLAVGLAGLIGLRLRRRG
jgi:MFS family permease